MRVFSLSTASGGLLTIGKIFTASLNNRLLLWYFSCRKQFFSLRPCPLSLIPPSDLAGHITCNLPWTTALLHLLTHSSTLMMLTSSSNLQMESNSTSTRLSSPLRPHSSNTCFYFHQRMANPCCLTFPRAIRYGKVSSGCATP